MYLTPRRRPSLKFPPSHLLSWRSHQLEGYTIACSVDKPALSRVSTFIDSALIPQRPVRAQSQWGHSVTSVALRAGARSRSPARGWRFLFFNAVELVRDLNEEK